MHGRATGGRNSSAHRDPGRPRTHHGRPNLGYGYLHNAIDDYSHLAYTEILPDETKESAAAQRNLSLDTIQDRIGLIRRLLAYAGTRRPMRA
ncbi:hypothetical protein [Nonomuraea angiospora]|uniref:hypothetical protein n=1 Tax=Nonomuraea angiospora TaxID=46172 RepID=UPI003EBD25FD